MKAIIVREHGGPEVLQYAELPLPQPAPGEVRVRIQCIGVNRRDAFIRAGLYPRALPLVPGIEASGVIDALGAGVTAWPCGTRVVYYTPGTLGAYAEYQVVAAQRLVKLPDGLPFEDAAAAFDHGLTAQYLTSSTVKLGGEHRVLVHAAAGGVGSLLVQFARQAGATVYATVSTPEKAAWLKQLGADQVILYQTEDFVTAVKSLTAGRGVDVVYDSVGLPTLKGSMRSLAPRGTLVLYGQSGGEVPAISPAELADAGSLYFTRPHLAHHIATPQALQERSTDLFTRLLNRSLNVRINGVFALADAAAAHRRLEDRLSFGKILLTP